MFKLLLTALAPLLILAGAAQAAEEKGASKQVGQYVDLQPVALPIVVKGALINYVFVYVRINLTAGADVQKLREKEPFFRDALVRQAHRTPFVVPTNYEKIDEPRLIATLTSEATAIAGPGVIQSVVVSSQSSQRHVPAPAAAPKTRP